MDWTLFHKSNLADEDIISGLAGIELLHEESPYHSLRTYFERVDIALSRLPSHHVAGALAAFSRVMYIPESLINETYTFFFGAVVRHARNRYDIQITSLEDMHLLEVDRSGMINDFVLRNALSKRLNDQILSRVATVDEALTSLERIASPSDLDANIAARHELATVSSKPAWLVLTDKALSGQSLVKDMQRFVALRHILKDPAADLPPIYICAQVAAEEAVSSIRRMIQEGEWDRVHLVTAVQLDSRLKINSDDCELFRSRSTLDLVQDLCFWFDEHIVSKDTSFDEVRRQSGSNLAFGYRGCGLLYADYRNCPTNSIPLLWYDTENKDVVLSPGTQQPWYSPPFPRVHSRRGSEKPRPKSVRWNEFLSTDGIARLRQAMWSSSDA